MTGLNIQISCNGADFVYRGYQVKILITSSKVVQLYLNGCLRKSSKTNNAGTQYVWTNIELEWEEHHYLEARYWDSGRKLTISMNRREFFSGLLPDGPAG